YEIAHHIGFSKDQEFEFLQMIAESDRQAMILSHLRQIVPVIIESERLKEKVRLNGHFKNLGELKF
ncbi:MAG: peptidase S16, partial [Chitinophagales bacterium]